MAGKLIEEVARIGVMEPEEFHQFELALVRLYRSDEPVQEAIAVAITRVNLEAADAVTRERVDEILAMLQHVHDPMISAQPEEAEVARCA